MSLPGLLLLFAAGAVATLDENTSSAMQAERPSAELAWTDLSGHGQTLEAFRGRVVVLNFWATWCAPCRKELPDLVRIQSRYGMYGVQVVGASADPPLASSSVVEFAHRYKINFPILLGANTDQMQALGAGEVLPATVVIDRQGQVIERISGVFELPKLEALLDRLVQHAQPTGDEEEAPLRVAAADPHDHGRERRGHDHPPHGGREASLVPS